MARSLLEVVKDVAARVGLPRPTNVVTGDGDLPPQYQSIIYESAHDIIRRNNAGWQALKMEHQFTTLAADQQFLLASLKGYRSICEDTVVNKTQRRWLRPMNGKEHAGQRVLNVAPPVLRYRIMGGKFLLPGNTVAGDVIHFEYDSFCWLTDSAGAVQKDRPTADTDLVVISDELLILGAKWRFKKENGLAYGEDFNDFERLCQELIGSDHPADELSLNRKGDSGLLGVNYNILIGS